MINLGGYDFELGTLSSNPKFGYITEYREYKTVSGKIRRDVNFNPRTRAGCDLNSPDYCHLCIIRQVILCTVHGTALNATLKAEFTIPPSHTTRQKRKRFPFW